MTKRRREPSLRKRVTKTTGSNYPKLSPSHKSPAAKYRVPVLKDEAPKPKAGHHYGRARLGTFMNAERIQREAAKDERKAKANQRTGPKISKIRKAFARVPLAAFRLGGGGGGGAGRK